jgi:hypothetical protein
MSVYGGGYSLALACGSMALIFSSVIRFFARRAKKRITKKIKYNCER